MKLVATHALIASSLFISPCGFGYTTQGRVMYSEVFDGEIRVDTSAPDEVAQLGGTWVLHARELEPGQVPLSKLEPIEVDVIELWEPDHEVEEDAEPVLTLDLSPEPGTTFELEPGESIEFELENLGVTNAELMPFCDQRLDIRVGVLSDSYAVASIGSSVSIFCS